MGKNTALVTNTCRTLSAKNYGRAHEIGHCIERIQLRLTFTSASREVGWTGTSRWVSKHARSPILAILVRFSKKTNILDWKTRNMWTVFFWLKSYDTCRPSKILGVHVTLTFPFPNQRGMGERGLGMDEWGAWGGAREYESRAKHLWLGLQLVFL